MDFVNVVRSINLTDPSWDLAVFAVFAVGVYLYVFRWGKDKAFVTLLGGYVALALMSKLALFEKVLGLGLGNDFANKAVLFLVTTLALTWVFSHSDFFSVFRRGMRRARFSALVISFLLVGFVVSAVVSFVPAAEARGLSIFLKAVFVDSGAQLFWLVTPLVATYLLKDN